MRVERHHRNPIRRRDSFHQPLAEHQKAQEPQRPAVHQALLHDEDDQLAAVRRFEKAGELRRTEVLPRRPAVGCIVPRVVSDPERGFDTDRLVVDPHFEVVRLQPPDRSAVVVDHAHVDDDAGDVDTLDDRLRLRRALTRREGPERGQEHRPTTARGHPAPPAARAATGADRRAARAAWPARARRPPRIRSGCSGSGRSAGSSTS